MNGAGRRSANATWILIVACLSAAPAPGSPEATFAAHGLAVAGTRLVARQEADVHDAARKVRAARAKVAADAAAIRAADADVAAATATAREAHARFKVTADAMASQPKDNDVIGRHNAAREVMFRADEQVVVAAARRDRASDSQAAYVTAVLTAARVADGAAHAYDAPAADPDVAAAVAAYAAVPGHAKLTLGPTPAFADDLAFVAKAAADTRSADVPVDIGDGGVPVVEVVLNGGVRRPMIWDSGAAVVQLNAETAAAAGIVPPPDAKTTVIVIADGSTIETREVVAPLLRVGPFTVARVPCVVLPAKMGHADNLLGGTFQRHFQARLDLAGKKLSLIPLDPRSAAVDATSPAAAAADGPAAKPLADRAAAAALAEERLRVAVADADRKLLAALGPAADAAVRADDATTAAAIAALRRRTQDRVDANEPAADAFGYKIWRGLGNNANVWTIARDGVDNSWNTSHHANAVRWRYESADVTWADGMVERLTRVDDRFVFIETWKPDAAADSAHAAATWITAAQPVATADAPPLTSKPAVAASAARDAAVRKARDARDAALAAADQRLLADLRGLAADPAAMVAREAAQYRLDAWRGPAARGTHPPAARWRFRHNLAGERTLAFTGPTAKWDGDVPVARTEWAGNAVTCRWNNGFIDRVTFVNGVAYMQSWRPEHAPYAPAGPFDGCGIGTPVQ